METLVLPENWVLEFEYRNIGRKPGDVLSTDKLKGFKMLEPEELTLAEKNRLTAAVQFLLKAGIAPECPVWAFEAGPDNIILGEYLPKEDRIVINRKQLQVSKRAVVETLFEEVMHRRSGEGDKTRAFQNALRAAWVDMAQEKVGEWL